MHCCEDLQYNLNNYPPFIVWKSETEDGISRFFQNADTCLPINIASYLRGQ
jgi:hypothetical protein